MGKGWKEWLLAGVIAWGIPWLTVGLMSVKMEEPPVETTVSRELIWVLDGEEQREMPLDDYLVGVLLGELPGDFHREAKQAQAVAARTYALRTVAFGVKHPGFVCTSSGCCQSWADPDSFSEASVAQAREAVERTEGLVLTYDGKLIDATYFSCSGGRTEDAVAVWGGDVPYLQSVESPGEEEATHYRDEVIFAESEFLKNLGLTGPVSIGNAAYTKGGGVDTMLICGKTFTGTQLRSLLGLRSTAITITLEPGQVRVTTQGFGHRVGMSQYGANAMAEAGHDFREILAHYYPGTQITS